MSRTTKDGGKPWPHHLWDGAMVCAVALTLLLAAWRLSTWAAPSIEMQAPLQSYNSTKQRETMDRVMAFLSAKHRSFELLKIYNRGLVCSHCCISSVKPDNDSSRPDDSFEFDRLMTVKRTSQKVWVTPKKPRQREAAGLSYMVWYPPFHNILFSIAQAADSWRTLVDIQHAKFSRLVLLRAPGSFGWLYKKLASHFTASSEASALPQGPRHTSCFEKVMLGSLHPPWEPYISPTVCTHPVPVFHKEDADWVPAFRQFMISDLPPPADISTPPGDAVPCHAVVQLRGGVGTARAVEARGRHFLNSQAVIDTVAAAGFRVQPMDLRNHSIESAAVSHLAAHLVVAPHGAGVANVLFCKPNTTLVELHNWGAQKYVYERYSGTLGLHYVPLHCKSQDDCPVNRRMWRRHFGKDAAMPHKASEDLCRRGVASADHDGYYDSNHTVRDINADLDSLDAVVRELIATLSAAGVCQAVHNPGLTSR